MRTWPFLSLLAVVCVLPVWASEPGQPLDCSDFVAVQPGFACVELSNPGLRNCTTATGAEIPCGGGSSAIDNESRFLKVFSEWLGACGSQASVYRRNVSAFQDGNWQVIGYFEERCKDAGLGYGDYTASMGITFDGMSGALLVALHDQCACNSYPVPPGDCPQFCPGWSPEVQYQSYWLAKITGFATTFDVLQTFTPEASLGFRVPYMPEGMAAADYFDTYWGDLSTVGNWGQAHGLQCHYPALPPARGDYLTAADTLPTPQPGRGYYYVTAATCQGQTRYGRKTSGGRLSGRDPAVLPPCGD